MNWHRHPKVLTAVRKIQQGQVIAYPTEAVWGLGCEPFNRHAVTKILTLKKRPVSKGLILVASDIEQFYFILNDLDSRLLHKLRASWPGHQTWLVPHQNRVPHWITGKFETVALRVSSHPIVQAICSQLDSPIVSTSANSAGCVAAKTSFRVRRYFGRDVFYAPGSVGLGSKPSQISDLISGEVLRS